MSRHHLAEFDAFLEPRAWETYIATVEAAAAATTPFPHPNTPHPHGHGTVTEVQQGVVTGYRGFPDAVELITNRWNKMLDEVIQNDGVDDGIDSDNGDIIRDRSVDDDAQAVLQMDSIVVDAARSVILSHTMVEDGLVEDEVIENGDARFGVVPTRHEPYRESDADMDDSAAEWVGEIVQDVDWRALLCDLAETGPRRSPVIMKAIKRIAEIGDVGRIAHLSVCAHDPRLLSTVLMFHITRFLESDTMDEDVQECIHMLWKLAQVSLEATLMIHTVLVAVGEGGGRLDVLRSEFAKKMHTITESSMTTRMLEVQARRIPPSISFILHEIYALSFQLEDKDMMPVTSVTGKKMNTPTPGDLTKLWSAYTGVEVDRRPSVHFLQDGSILETLVETVFGLGGVDCRDQVRDYSLRILVLASIGDYDTTAYRDLLSTMEELKRTLGTVYDIPFQSVVPVIMKHIEVPLAMSAACTWIKRYLIMGTYYENYFQTQQTTDAIPHLVLEEIAFRQPRHQQRIAGILAAIYDVLERINAGERSWVSRLGSSVNVLLARRQLLGSMMHIAEMGSWGPVIRFLESRRGRMDASLVEFAIEELRRCQRGGDNSAARVEEALNALGAG